MITHDLMAVGSWDLTLRPDTPGDILDRLNDWAALLVITAQHAPIDVATTITHPLYKGPLLTRTGRYTASGAGPAWYLGTSDDDPNGTSAVGPYFAQNFSGTSVATVMGTICAKNGVTPGTYTSGTVTGNLHNTARTCLDRILCPQLDAEWRINTDLTVDLDTVANLYGTTPQALIVRGSTSRGTGDIPGWHATAIDPTLDFADWRNRAVSKYDAPSVGWVDTGAPGPGTTWRAPDGTPLEMAGFDDGNPNAFAAGLQATRNLALWNTAQRTVSVTLDDYLIIDSTRDPAKFVGGYIAVFDPEIGLYDRGNQMAWDGQMIFPAKIRVTGITWPITRGVGVYLDNRHQTGGGFVDVTEHVAWDDGETTLTLGQPPRWWTGKRRIVAR